MIPDGSPLHSLIATSLFVSLVIALLLPFRPLLRLAIGSQWVCALWLLLLMRLLFPLPLESRWGLMNRWQKQTIPTAMTAEPWKIKVSFPDKTNAQGVPSPVAPPPAPANFRVTGFLLNIPLTIWLCGFAAGLVILAVRWNQTRRLAARTLPATNERLLRIFSSISAPWRRNVELRMTYEMNVPTLAGILRPQIWMPQEWPEQFTDGELRNILLHEIGHTRRGDLAVQWLFAFAQCLHWFNPFVWLAARAARFDREMACDAWVLMRNGADVTRAYGATLLKTAQLFRAPFRISTASVAMASGRQSLQARIAGIGAFRPTRIWPGMLGVALMIAALAVTTTRRISAGETPTPVPTVSTTQPTVTPTSESQHSPSGDSKAGTGTKNLQIELESKFVEIPEDAWQKLCAADPAIHKISIKLPELKQEKKSYAAIESELNALTNGEWEFKQGAWEISGLVELLSILSPEEMQKMMSSLNRKDVDLIASPSVTTLPRQRAVVEIIREFYYPDAFEIDKKSPAIWTPKSFVTKNLGVTLEVNPDSTDYGGVNLQLNPTVSSFLGFQQEANGTKKVVSRSGRVPKGWFQRPIFSTSRGAIMTGVQPHQTVLLGGVRIDGRDGGEMQTVRHILLIFVTPKIVEAKRPSPTGPPPQAARVVPSPDIVPDLPHGIPVKGKPGNVMSPYVPVGGSVDLGAKFNLPLDAGLPKQGAHVMYWHGFSKDSVVKDPDTGQSFLIP